jgi:hypothetical protein
MYRRYVYAVYGTLGQGVRIRIPPCVMEAIRHRLREPACNCPTGGPLANCSMPGFPQHGYTGFKDA